MKHWNNYSTNKLLKKGFEPIPHPQTILLLTIRLNHRIYKKFSKNIIIYLHLFFPYTFFSTITIIFKPDFSRILDTFPTFFTANTPWPCVARVGHPLVFIKNILLTKVSCSNIMNKKNYVKISLLLSRSTQLELD